MPAGVARTANPDARQSDSLTGTRWRRNSVALKGKLRYTRVTAFS